MSAQIYETSTREGSFASLQRFSKDLSEHDRECHRASFMRFLELMTGTEIKIDLVDGSSYQGIFHTATPFRGKEYVMAVKSAKPCPSSSNHVETVARGSTFVVDDSVFASVLVTGVEITSKINNSDILVDSSIRKNIAHLHGRALESVASSWLDPETTTSLEGESQSSAAWNQFEVNRKLFNVKSTYDENVYTKKLDLNGLSVEKIAEAERLAREIESSSSTNIHMQEERGHAPQKEMDLDEEDLYSGVLRNPDPSGSGSWRQGNWRSPVSGKTSPGPPPGLASPVPPPPAPEPVVEEAPVEEVVVQEPPPPAPEEPKKSSLNPDAPAFKLSVDAPEFIPRFTPAQSPAPAPAMLANAMNMNMIPSHFGYMPQPPFPYPEYEYYPHIGSFAQPMMGQFMPYPGVPGPPQMPPFPVQVPNHNGGGGYGSRGRGGRGPQSSRDLN